MAIDACFHIFDEIAATVLPAHMARLRTEMTSRSPSPFCRDGIERKPKRDDHFASEVAVQDRKVGCEPQPFSILQKWPRTASVQFPLPECDCRRHVKAAGPLLRNGSVDSV